MIFLINSIVTINLRSAPMIHMRFRLSILLFGILLLASSILIGHGLPSVSGAAADKNSDLKAESLNRQLPSNEVSLAGMARSPIALKEYLRNIEDAGDGSADGYRNAPRGSSIHPDSSSRVLGGVSTFGAHISDGYTRVEAVAVQPDGKIIAGGNFPLANGIAKPGLARFNADGSLDQSFTGVSGFFMDIVVQPDGKILVAGSATGVARLNSDGSADATFTPGVGTSSVSDILLLPDNSSPRCIR